MTSSVAEAPGDRASDADIAAALRLDALADLARPLALRALPEASPGALATRIAERLRTSCGESAMYLLRKEEVAAALPALPQELRAWGRAVHTLRSGEAAFVRANGRGYWAMLEAEPDYAARTAAMIALSNRIVVRQFRGAAVWADHAPLLDLGSGDASFLAGLLEAHPDLQAIAFDLPRQAALAAQRLEAAGLSARTRVVAGDFFRDPIPQARGYLLKNILHDCGDAEASGLLSGIRTVIPADGRLFVIEAFPEPDNRYDIGKLLDVNSLVLVGGHDRSLPEYRALLEASGFGVLAVHRTGNALAMIEAEPRCA